MILLFHHRLCPLLSPIKSGRMMSAVNDILSLLGVWGDSDADSDMTGVVMTGMQSLSIIKDVNHFFQPWLVVTK